MVKDGRKVKQKRIKEDEGRIEGERKKVEDGREK
jgi:hypothetical protein